METEKELAERLLAFVGIIPSTAGLEVVSDLRSGGKRITGKTIKTDQANAGVFSLFMIHYLLSVDIHAVDEHGFRWCSLDISYQHPSGGGNGYSLTYFYRQDVDRFMTREQAKYYNALGGTMAETK